jgi:predicted nucleic acid-binding protein
LTGLIATTAGPSIASKNLRSRFWCGEPVLAETMYLLRSDARVPDVLFEYLHNGALHIAFRIEEHVSALRKLLKKYEDTPISLADACVVRMAEIHERHAVLTLDSDFSVYRKHGRVAQTLIHPAG